MSLKVHNQIATTDRSPSHAQNENFANVVFSERTANTRNATKYALGRRKRTTISLNVGRATVSKPTRTQESTFQLKIHRDDDTRFLRRSKEFVIPTSSSCLGRVERCTDMLRWAQMTRAHANSEQNSSARELGSQRCINPNLRCLELSEHCASMQTLS